MKVERISLGRKTLAKVSPVIAKLETHLQHQSLKLVPKAVLGHAKSSLEKVKAMEREAKADMLGESSLSFDHDDVVDTCKDGEASARSLSDFLQTIDRHDSTR